MAEEHRHDRSAVRRPSCSLVARLRHSETSPGTRNSKARSRHQPRSGPSYLSLTHSRTPYCTRIFRWCRNGEPTAVAAHRSTSIIKKPSIGAAPSNPGHPLFLTGSNFHDGALAACPNSLGRCRVCRLACFLRLVAPHRAGLKFSTGRGTYLYRRHGQACMMLDARDAPLRYQPACPLSKALTACKG
jgi:hypothetical protein